MIFVFQTNKKDNLEGNLKTKKSEGGKTNREMAMKEKAVTDKVKIGIFRLESITNPQYVIIILFNCYNYQTIQQSFKVN